MRNIILFAYICCMPAILYAQQRRTWTGAVSNQYKNAANWDRGALPLSIDTVYIPVTARSPLLTGAATCSVLILEGDSLILNQKKGGPGSLTVIKSAWVKNGYLGGGGHLSVNEHLTLTNSVLDNAAGSTIIIKGNLSTVSSVIKSGSVTVSGNLSATSSTFTGGVLTLFGNLDASNLICNASHELILTGANPAEITGSSITFQNVTVDRYYVFVSGDVTLNGPGTLKLTNGLLYIDGSLLLSAATSISGGSQLSYIGGEFSKIINPGNQLLKFPLGPNGYNASAPNYRPFEAEMNVLATCTLTISYVPEPATNVSSLYGQGIARVSNIEYFILKVSNPPAVSSGKLTLSWGYNSSFIPGEKSNFRVARFDGIWWVNMGNSAVKGSTASGTVTSETKNGSFFSNNDADCQYAVASDINDISLPVSLIHFTAESSESGVNLSWITASELNNDYFILERSENGTAFTEIAKISGAGWSVTPIEYTYKDENPGTGTVYYRLRQADLSGVSSLSQIIAVNLKGGLRIWAAKPTEEGAIQLIYTVPVETSARIQITELSGRVLYNSEQVFNGSGTLFLPVQTSGPVLIRVSEGESVTVIKTAVLR